jgi:hypothetical protein
MDDLPRRVERARIALIRDGADHSGQKSPLIISSKG